MSSLQKELVYGKKKPNMIIKKININRIFYKNKQMKIIFAFESSIYFEK